ncbi:MAG: serine hydrolase [Pseudomonadota bacterium]
MINLRRILLTAVSGFSIVSGANAADLSPEQIDGYAKQTISAFHLTGLSLTVVSRESILFQKSYGLRDVNGKTPVDTDTTFPFGSIGKAFTTAALAMLVDEGKMAWNDPVKKYIPEFEMSDPYITAEFSVKDLVTHRSGLPLGAGDLLVFPDADPGVKDILAAMKHIPPATSFRSEFAYDNQLYVIAGEVLSRIDQKPWADAIASRLFKPLGMKSCDAKPTRAARAKNTVTQHTRAPGDVAATPLDPRYILADATAPAGGISCSIADLSKWAQFWLRGAKTQSGKQLISTEQASELWTGVTPKAARPDMTERAGTHFSLYGLGWDLSDFYGELLVSHGGGLLGAVSFFGMLPEKDIAVFLTTNDFVPYVSGLGVQILADAAAPENDTTWISYAAKNYDNYRTNAGKDSGESAVNDIAVAPLRPLADYAGVYVDPWYGKVTISVSGDRLAIDMSRSEILDAPLTSLGDNKFVARWPDRTINADAYVMFSEENGAISGMTMKAVSKTADFSFDFHDLHFVKAADAAAAR